MAKGNFELLAEHHVLYKPIVKNPICVNHRRKWLGQIGHPDIGSVRLYSSCTRMGLSTIIYAVKKTALSLAYDCKARFYCYQYVFLVQAHRKRFAKITIGFDRLSLIIDVRHRLLESTSTYLISERLSFVRVNCEKLVCASNVSSFKSTNKLWSTNKFRTHRICWMGIKLYNPCAERMSSFHGKLFYFFVLLKYDLGSFLGF